MTQKTPNNSLGLHFSDAKECDEIRMGLFPTRRQIQFKFGGFRPISLCLRNGVW